MLTEHADCRACGAPAARKPATTHAKTSDDTCGKPMHTLTLLLIAVARRTRSHFHTPRSPDSLHTLCPLALLDALTPLLTLPREFRFQLHHRLNMSGLSR